MANRVDIDNHVTAQSTTSAPSGGMPKWKIALPIAIIAICVAWIVFTIVGGGTPELQLPPEKVSASKILNAIGDREDLLEMVQVRTEGVDEQLTVKVTGYVKTKALLDELTTIVKTAAGDVPVTMDVKVKR